MPKGGSLAYLFDGTEVQPVSLPPSGNTQLGEKKGTPHERPAELPSVTSSDRFRPPLAILPPPHLEYVLNPGPLSGGSHPNYLAARGVDSPLLKSSGGETANPHCI